jgi:hypothetical protein
MRTLLRIWLRWPRIWWVVGRNWLIIKLLGVFTPPSWLERMAEELDQMQAEIQEDREVLEGKP